MPRAQGSAEARSVLAPEGVLCNFEDFGPEWSVELDYGCMDVYASCF